MLARTLLSRPKIDAGNTYGISNPDSVDLLFSNPKVFLAFDLLAEKINQYLDYPSILIENGIQGIATLDLYFDDDGSVDEARSKFFGDNRWVRGLLVRAARQGILKWYVHDTFRLKKSEFRNQHFRADFEISYSQPSSSKIEKTGSGFYTFTRRHYMHECADPTGVSVTCLAMKIYGATERRLSSDYRMKYEALKDQLEYFDNTGLNNLNSLIKST
jgi:hypothetical protein